MIASALAVLHVRMQVIVGPKVNALQSVQVRRRWFCSRVCHATTFNGKGGAGLQ